MGLTHSSAGSKSIARLWPRTAWAVGCALLLTPAAQAAGLLITLIVPSDSSAPGSTVPVGLLAANSDNRAQDFTAPATLSGILTAGGQTWKVQLTSARTEDRESLVPGGFANHDYNLTLPSGVTGQAVLEISGGLSAPVRAVVMISATATSSVASVSPSSAAAAEVPAVGNRTAVSTLQRSFVDHFTTLDPVYFIYGPKAPAAKFQFSFKYRIVSLDDGKDTSPESTVQFGYTQRSLWDVNAHSSPFYDTSYMPSLFYQFLTSAPNRKEDQGGVTWLGFASGYQHESNGMDSTASRSINQLYLRSGALIGRPDRWHSIVQLRVFDYAGDLSDNPYIKDYRGYGDWLVTLAKGDGPSLTYTGRAGKDFNHWTAQFDLSIPVKTKVLDFATYLLIQYFDGYGESLRDYTKYSDTVRAGISLVR